MKETKFIAGCFDFKSLMKSSLNHQNKKKNEASKLSLKIPQFIKWVARIKMYICFQIQGPKKAWRKIKREKHQNLNRL